MPSLSNFSFMDEYASELATTGASAEQVLLGDGFGKDPDPINCINLLRSYAENLSKLVGQKSDILKENRESQDLFLQRLKNAEVIDDKTWSLFERLRFKGNKAVHGNQQKRTQNKALQRSNVILNMSNTAGILKLRSCYFSNLQEL